MGFDLSKLSSLIKADIGTNPSRAGVLGVDIGTSTIKVVQIHDEKGVPTLDTYGELQLGPYEGIDLGRSTHLPPQKSVEALVDILREAGATAKNVAFSLSYNSCFTTTMEILTLEQEELSAMVLVEARKYIPISLTKVDFSWFPIAQDSEKGTTTVFVSAIYNSAKDQYTTIMQGSGLGIIGSEIELFSLIRATLTPTDEIVALLDFGASGTRLCIVEKGVIVKTHSVLLSGVEITSALAKELEISFAEAEELKRQAGLPGKEDDPRVQKSIVTALERGLRELHTVIKRFESTRNTTIQKVLLTGSGAQLHGLSTYIEDMFTRPVATANPFAKVAFPAFLEDTLTQSGTTFASAIGIALGTLQK